MPELPEVETVVRSLEKLIKNKRIISVIVNYTKMIKTDINDFKNNLINQRFIDFKRRGKYLILELDDYILLSHLRMEGKFYYGKDINLKHIHVIFNLDDGNNLYYQDFRKFGTMSLFSKDIDIEKIINIGVDANSDEVDYLYLTNNLSKSNRSIKEMLLNQKVIAGIGNIYADEICHRCKIHPASTCSKLSENDYKNLEKNIKLVLNEAIEIGLKDISLDGRFDLSSINYLREKNICKYCNNEIIKIKHKGRGTYLCDKCQKLKK